jgi:hypothetical protein
MPRALKAYSQEEPRSLQIAAPKSNKFTLDLAGIDLTEDQLDQVRSEAVKAAMLSAAGLLAGGGRLNLDDFGTFSTFSTFSTFGSGPAMKSKGSDVTSGAEIANPVLRKVIRSKG